MAWSKSTRISIMLAIDVAFFLLELIVGFIVSSLALMADAFHMVRSIESTTTSCPPTLTCYLAQRHHLSNSRPMGC